MYLRRGVPVGNQRSHWTGVTICSFATASETHADGHLIVIAGGGGLPQPGRQQFTSALQGVAPVEPRGRHHRHESHRAVSGRHVLHLQNEKLASTSSVDEFGAFQLDPPAVQTHLQTTRLSLPITELCPTARVGPSQDHLIVLAYSCDRPGPSNTLLHSRRYQKSSIPSLRMVRY